MHRILQQTHRSRSAIIFFLWSVLGSSSVSAFLPKQAVIPATTQPTWAKCATFPYKIMAQNQRTELESEEPLSVMFQRAVVLQRSGNHQEALEEYSLFLKAAQQCQVDPAMYAEVYGNMGALYLRQKKYKEAREHLQKALLFRPQFGTAHVNLAVVALQQASSGQTSSQKEAIGLMETAKQHCQDALDCNTDPQSVAMAQRLLEDIDKMLSQ